jgi:hypothetical protein
MNALQQKYPLLNNNQMYKKISLLIFGLIICQALSTVSAQQPVPKVFYDPVGAVLGYSIVKTEDNNFVIAGEKDTRAFALKIDPTGVILWSKSIGNPQGVFYTVTAARDGGFVFAGKIGNPSSGNSDIICAKFNSAGDTLWTRTIDMGSNDEAISIKQTIDDGYILSGDGGQGGMCVVKLDAGGLFTWGKLYTLGNYINYAFGVDQTPDQGYVVSGVYGNQPAFTSDMFLMKTDPTGAVTWAEKETPSGIHYFTGFDVKVVTGGIMSLYSTQDSGWVLTKTDLTGTKLWSKYYFTFTTGVAPGYNPKIHQTSDGGFVFDYSQAHFIGGMIKVDVDGNYLWSQDLSMSATDLAEASNGDFMLIGNGPVFGVNSNQTLNPQLGIVSTDAQGNGAACTNPTGISTGNYTVTSPAVAVTASTGGAVSLFATPVNNVTLTTEGGCVYFTGGIEEKNQNKITINVFPNPSDGVFTVSGNGAAKQDIQRIEVFNMLGDQVYVSSDKQDLLLPVDIGQVPAGIYTVKALFSKGIGTSEIVICH